MQNQMKKLPDIYIIHAELSANKEDIYSAGLIDDEELITSINEYKKDLDEENVEIFKQDKNILITENGYYIAVYETDLSKRVDNYEVD